MFSDFVDWFFEKFCMTFLMSLILVCISGLIYCGYYLYDKIITQQTYTNCTSVSKRIVPPYTTFILSGKVLVPITQPTSYEVNQICEQGQRSISVDKSLYVTINLPEN